MTSKKKRYSFFIGLLDICGIYGSLNRGLNDIGHKSYILNLGEEKSGNIESGDIPWTHKFYLFSYKLVKKNQNKKIFWIKNKLCIYLNLLSLIFLVIWILVKIDIILLKSGEGFSSELTDLKIFKFFKKKIIFWFHGADERAPYFYLQTLTHKKINLKKIIKKTLELKQNINAKTNYADLVIGNPLSGHLHKKPVLIYNVLGNPVDKSKIQHRKIVNNNKKKIRILHAPSNPVLKGSKIIRKEIKALMNKGFKFDYIEISNCPNSKVIEELGKCDIFIDELWSDTYGAVASTEAAMMGKPAVVCGYGLKEMNRLIPQEFRMPTNFVEPANLSKMLIKLITNPKYREQSALKMQRFYKEKTNNKNVARNFVKAINGDFNNLLVLSENINYFLGAGADKKIIISQIQSVVDFAGISGLCLNDNPNLLNNFQKFLNKQN